MTSPSQQPKPALLRRQYKADVEIVPDASDDRLIKGYTSIFGVTDSYGDIVEQGAFDRTLNTPEERDRVVVLWQHNAQTPIGLPTVMREDSKGLYVEARISKTAAGNDALELIRDRVVKELSIGFDLRRFEVTDDKTDDGWPIWILKDVLLREWSPVTWGACPGTSVEVLKSLKLQQTRRLKHSVNSFFRRSDPLTDWAEAQDEALEQVLEQTPSGMIRITQRAKHTPVDPDQVREWHAAASRLQASGALNQARDTHDRLRALLAPHT